MTMARSTKSTRSRWSACQRWGLRQIFTGTDGDADGIHKKFSGDGAVCTGLDAGGAGDGPGVSD